MYALRDIENLYLLPEISRKATSKSSNLCVTQPIQNAHLHNVNSDFGSVANPDFVVFRSCHKAEVEYFPCVYVEADIDFNDIRTGYKGKVKLARALKIYDSYATPGWSEEVILDANLDRIQEIPPQAARFRPLPGFINAQFINVLKNRYMEYLTRTWKKILHRNSELNIYSGAGESREEFVVRCTEQFLGRMREEISRMRVVFNRMLEQLKEKYLGICEAQPPDSASLTPEASDRDIYSRYAERIAALFLNATSSAVDAEFDATRIGKNSELEERLIALTAEAYSKIALLRESYEKKAELADEYILRPNLKNIHCERSCILWMPTSSEVAICRARQSP